jgi:hypothetical protein
MLHHYVDSSADNAHVKASQLQFSCATLFEWTFAYFCCSEEKRLWLRR